MASQPHNALIALIAAAAMLACSACSDEAATAAQQDDQPDAQTQDVPQDDDTAEPDADEPITNPCLEMLAEGTTFEAAPNAPDTQIHASVAFDGQSVWVVYNQPEQGDGGNFDVMVTRLGCDGQAQVDPIKVNTLTGINFIDPTVAWGGDDRLVVAWQGDNGMQPNNLDVYMRTFARDGAPNADQETLVETNRNGQTQNGNAWMTKVRAMADGQGFVLAGARGLEEAGRFQTFIQRLTPNAQLDGDTADGFFLAEVTQVEPAVAVTDDGTIWAAWTSGDGDGDIVHNHWSPGDQTPGEPAMATLGSPSGGATMVTMGDGQRVALAFQANQGGDSQIILKDAAVEQPDGIQAIFGVQGRIDAGPKLAANDTNGGAIFWHRVISGFRTELFIRGFEFPDDGSTPRAVGDEQQIPTDAPAALYQPAMVHVGDGVYFLVWSEGDNPAFRLKGRFVRL